MSIPTTLRHIANALVSVAAAYESEESGCVCDFIQQAETALFRALREIANGQIGHEADTENVVSLTEHL